MDTDQERYSLPQIRKQLADGTKLPSPSESAWLLEEAERLTRANRAYDREVVRLEAELKAKDADYTGAENELLDVSEALVKCREELEAARVQLAAELASH